jgi:hypothetical protein
MKAYGGVDAQSHIFLTSALVGGEWSASRPGRFTPGERAPETHWIGDWVGPRAGLDNLEKKFFILPGIELWPVLQPVASRYTDYAISAPITCIYLYKCFHGYIFAWKTYWQQDSRDFYQLGSAKWKWHKTEERLLVWIGITLNSRLSGGGLSGLRLNRGFLFKFMCLIFIHFCFTWWDVTLFSH